MLSHALKDCPSSSKNPQQKNGDLQYGACIRGEPIRRGFKDSFKLGMGSEDEGRSWVAGERMKEGAVKICVVREKEGGDRDHVPRLDTRGRVVHGSSRIRFRADPYSTRWSRVTKN